MTTSLGMFFKLGAMLVQRVALRTWYDLGLASMALNSGGGGVGWWVICCLGLGWAVQVGSLVVKVFLFGKLVCWFIVSQTGSRPLTLFADTSLAFINSKAGLSIFDIQTRETRNSTVVVSWDSLTVTVTFCLQSFPPGQSSFSLSPDGAWLLVGGPVYTATNLQQGSSISLLAGAEIEVAAWLHPAALLLVRRQTSTIIHHFY